MAIATYYKYSLNRDLRLQLFETSGAEIIEVNPTDKRWGIGLPMDDWRIRDKNEWKWVKFGVFCINLRISYKCVF